MADKHYFTVTEGTFSRSNADGSMTTFMKGETVELEDPSAAERHKNLVPTPPGGRLPSPDGFVRKSPSHEVSSTTATSTLARDKAATEALAKGKPAKPAIPVLSTDPHKVEKA